MKRLNLKDAIGFSKEYTEYLMQKTIEWIAQNRGRNRAEIAKAADQWFSKNAVAPYDP